MFKAGDLVSKIGDGICRVTQISDLAFGGKPKRAYYELEPIAKSGSKIFIPVANSEDRMRAVMNQSQALELIDKIPSLEPVTVDNEKQREHQYQMALQSNRPEQWAQVIKTIYYRREERFAEGKKNTSVDNRYFKIAEDCLYSELSVVLGEDQPAIVTRIETAAKAAAV